MKTAGKTCVRANEIADKSRMKGDDIAVRLEDFGSGIVRIVRALPNDRAAKHMADQLLRSGTAGGSNYEEARSAQSRRDFIHKVSLAAKEMREALYWLGIVGRSEPDLNNEAEELKREGTELVAILMASAKTARAAAKQATGH